MFPKSKPTDQRALFLQGASHISLLQAVETFLRLEMPGKSPATREWYERRLYPLARTLGEERPLADLLENDLLDWYQSLQFSQRRYVGASSHPEIPGGLSTDTIHGYVRACKRLFKWLYQKGILSADLAADLRLPRLPRRGKKGIAETNRQAILEAVRSNPRDLALVLFIESTGVRRGGVANLKLSDLDLEASDERLRRRVSVREKGDKERLVIMSREALAALQAWLAVRPTPQLDAEYVFLGCSPGQPWHRLSPDGISGIIDRYKKALGLSGPCSPHQWRHRFARHRLHKGMDLSQVSQLLGHEDVSITVRFYGQFSADQLQEAYDRFSDD